MKCLILVILQLYANLNLNIKYELKYERLLQLYLRHTMKMQQHEVSRLPSDNKRPSVYLLFLKKNRKQLGAVAMTLL